MEIIRLETASGPVFETICRWNYEWWGKDKLSGMDELRCFMAHALCRDRVPQTYVALADGKPVGMYQLLMSDDLVSRPDIYPWLANVYVDEACRGNGICRRLMESVRENAKALGLTQVYLYTHHVGLYEKFGWEPIEQVNAFKPDAPAEQLYGLKI